MLRSLSLSMRPASVARALRLSAPLLAAPGTGSAVPALLSTLRGMRVEPPNGLDDVNAYRPACESDKCPDNCGARSRAVRALVSNTLGGASLRPAMRPMPAPSSSSRLRRISRCATRCDYRTPAPLCAFVVAVDAKPFVLALAPRIVDVEAACACACCADACGCGASAASAPTTACRRRLADATSDSSGDDERCPSSVSASSLFSNTGSSGGASYRPASRRRNRPSSIC